MRLLASLLVLAALIGCADHAPASTPAAVEAPAPEPAPVPEPEPEPVLALDPGDPIVLRASDLGDGRASYVFRVDRSCPLARVELDLEVESMPDGRVQLTSPRGTRASLSLHVLTTTHFVRTWDWARLEALHGERGRDAEGDWTLEIAASGALYRGGAQPSAAPMPTPSFPSAELRVFCEPPTRAHDPSDDTIRVVRDVPRATRRPGASVRALLPVSEACTIETLCIEIHDTARYASGVRWTLVAPAGDTMRLSGWRYAGAGEGRKLVACAPRARGLASAGLWEVLAPRASGTTELRRAGLTIECGP